MGGYLNGVELAQGDSVTNGTTLSFLVQPTFAFREEGQRTLADKTGSLSSV